MSMTDGEIYQNRLERLSTLTDDAGIFAVIINHPADVLYYSGFKSSNAIIVLTGNERIFFTDFRYYESALKALSKVFTVVKVSGNLYSFPDQFNIRQSGTLGLSFSYTSYTAVKFLESKFDNSIRFVDIDTELNSVRSIKDHHEISKIEDALQVSEKIIVDAFSWLSGRHDLTEMKFQSFIRTRLLQANVTEAFETISVFGANAANCHATPTSAVYSSNLSCCLIDMGAKKEYYCSDITRTVIPGSNNSLNSQRMQNIRKIVIEAKHSSIERVAPGVICADVDKAGRNVIAGHGYGDFFGHGMGHGVGLEIHEFPRVSPSSQTELVPGMVITIEPGIYIPDLGGIRMEDMVLVTSTGYRVLNQLGDDW